MEGFLSLGLNDDAPMGALAPEPRHKSAGLAFGLSFLIPGLGQFYCGKTARGGATFAFWVLGLVLCFSGVPAAISGQALVVMLVLWIFSFLDAYFTAIEINRNQEGSTWCTLKSSSFRESGQGHDSNLLAGLRVSQ